MSALNVMERPDLFFLDQAFRWRGVQEPAPEVAIVAVSKEDFDRGAPRWPWPRCLMARLVDRVNSHQPAVIVLDILYSQRTNSESLITQERLAQIQPYVYQALAGQRVEVQTRGGVTLLGPGTPVFEELGTGGSAARLQDLELVHAVRRAVDNGVAVVLAAQTVNSFSTEGRATSGVAGLVEPFPELLAGTGAKMGLVGIKLDSDGVLRRYLPYGLDKEGRFVYGLALVAVAEYQGLGLPTAPAPDGDVLVRGPSGYEALAKIEGGQFLVNFRGPAGTHTTVNAHELLRGDIDHSRELEGNIVFIGVTDPSIEDMLPTPFSGLNRIAGVEFHAAAADTLITSSFISSTPRYQVILLVLVVGLGRSGLGAFRASYLRAGWRSVGAGCPLGVLARRVLVG